MFCHTPRHLDRHRQSPPEVLESRTLCAAWLPGNLARPGVPVRVSIQGGTAGATGLPGTTGIVQHGPGGKGWAVITLPDNPTADEAAHEFGHALGLVHVSQGPSAPDYTAAEWVRLDAFGATVGWSQEVVRAQYGKQAGARDNGFDPASLWNSDPFTHPATSDTGPGPHLSGGDRQALHDLFGAGGPGGAMATHRGGRRGR
jgi:hypothetical protein